MAYRFDIYDDSLVIDGWENGIAPDPYEGTANLKNVNITAIPGEASAGFTTKGVMTAPTYSNIEVAATGDGFSLTAPAGSIPALEEHQAVYFTASSITGITAGTAVYWATSVTNLSNLLSITSEYGGTGALTIGTTGTATMYVFPLELGAQTGRGGLVKNYLKKSTYNTDGTFGGYHWLLDSRGRVWSDIVITAGGDSSAPATHSWTYTGNQANVQGNSNFDASAHGNGLAYWRTSTLTAQPSLNLDGWLFVFRDGQIDYLKVESNGNGITPATLSWVYGWDPGYVPNHAGTSGNTDYLSTGASSFSSQLAVIPSHEAIVTPDDNVVWCDGATMGQLYQAAEGTSFNPLSSSSFNFDWFKLILPVNDVAQTVTYFGSGVLIGGSLNQIYPWDLTSQTYTNPLILLPENNVANIVTVNLQAYIFCGNRGNIYLTQGSQAQWYAKVPDHLSGTVQPTMAWGDAIYNQNHLYFGVAAVPNGKDLLDYYPLFSGYGGIWGIDLKTKSMFVSNILSGGAGAYASALLAEPQTVFADFNGYGNIAAWSTQYANGSSGIDMPLSTPSTDGSAIIETEIIPMGTVNKPRNFTMMEYRLVKPMVAGESIKISGRTTLDGTYKSFITDSYDSNNPDKFSRMFAASLPADTQWAQFQIVLTSTGTTPSYVRLKDIRVLGLTGPTLAQAMELNV